jgi:copper homeostasis protein (lipoprotein)
MTRTTWIPVSLCLAFIALAGCRREEPAAPTVAPPATIAPASVATIAAPTTTTTPLGVAASAAPGEHTDFDAKAFAGSFAAPGTRISFDADGNYTMRVHAESANADLDTQGTWTLEPDARHVLLDPTSKAEPDRRYEVASMDELRPDDGGTALQREGTH